MTHLIIPGICLVVGFLAGLLVGRKNPKVANAAAEFSASVQAAAEKKP